MVRSECPVVESIQEWYLKLFNDGQYSMDLVQSVRLTFSAQTGPRVLSNSWRVGEQGGSPLGGSGQRLLTNRRGLSIFQPLVQPCQSILAAYQSWFCVLPSMVGSYSWWLCEWVMCTVSCLQPCSAPVDSCMASFMQSIHLMFALPLCLLSSILPCIIVISKEPCLLITHLK